MSMKEISGTGQWPAAPIRKQTQRNNVNRVKARSEPESTVKAIKSLKSQQSRPNAAPVFVKHNKKT